MSRVPSCDHLRANSGPGTRSQVLRFPDLPCAAKELERILRYSSDPRIVEAAQEYLDEWRRGAS